MTTPWIDFRELRERLDFDEVLRHYGFEPKTRKGPQWQGFCPLPSHNGQRRSPSFSVNLDRKVWRCFGACQASGNVLDFAVRMEKLDPGNTAHVREVALRLAERFAPDVLRRGKSPTAKPAAPKVLTDLPDDGGREEAKAQKNAGRGATRPALVNAPLDFMLRGLDASHPYLKERGLTAETIAHFGLGYCARGLLQGRIAIPLHDAEGKLVGYAGRLVEGERVGDHEPKYLFPSSRERNGVQHEFRKGLFLYNGFQAGQDLSDLVVVEGFPSVWWLWQSGVPHVVALMGSSCSGEQAELIAQAVRPDGRVWVFPDGDDAGERCAKELLACVAPHRFVHWVRLEDGAQPTDLPEGDLRDLLLGGAAPREEVADAT